MMKPSNSRISSKARDRRSSLAELEHLRSQMADVTESILRLSKLRQDIANEIADIKDSNGIPIEDLQVEKRLKSRVGRYASKIELNKSLALEITDVLLNSSKTAQRKRVFETKITSFLSRNRISSISIVGAGRMGGWFGAYFRALGMRVILFDKKRDFAKQRAKELGCEFAGKIQELMLSDLIIVAVPVGATPHEINRLEDALRNNGGTSKSRCRAIIEISSIKEKVLNQLAERPRVPVISIHPLFGAYALNFDRNMILLVQSGRKRADGFGLHLIENLFPQFNVLQIRAKEHDKQMALMLSLPHVLALAFADVISRNSPTIRNKGASAPSYAALRELATKTFSENPDVYYEIQSMNNFNPIVLRELLGSVEKLARCFETGAKSEFKGFFETTRARMG